MKSRKNLNAIYIKKMVSIIIIFVILIYSLINISSASNQQISDNINGIDTNLYPGIKERILQLKAKHPNWNFKILYTNLSWDEVISNEYQGHGSSPRNLIYNQSNYQGNWICSTCGDRPYDNGNWRCASESAIAYMMDPRNSLNDSDIFQFEELTASSSDINIVKNMTNGTFLRGHEQGIVEISNKNGVNSYYIVARLIQEQGKNGSALVSGSTGYYNAFNIGASGNTSSEIIANGLAYAQRKGWDTLEKSIDGGIGFITDQYIKKGQNTLYLQKFNVTDSGTYWRQYQQNLMAAQKEGEALRNTYLNTNSFDSQHTFIIPVYKNMPAEPVKRPDGSNHNNTTVDLVKVNVDSSLKIRRTPEDSTAIGWLWKDEIATRLEKATTKINGTYWDKIRKSDGTVGYTARETFDYESKYKLYLVPVSENQNSGNSGGNSQSGSQGESGNVNTPEVPNNPNFIKGDVDKDNQITANDYAMIKNHIMGVNTLNDEQKQRADYDNDNEVTANDYALIKKYIMER